jgi:hypothetical protein
MLNFGLNNRGNAFPVDDFCLCSTGQFFLFGTFFNAICIGCKCFGSFPVDGRLQEVIEFCIRTLQNVCSTPEKQIEQPNVVLAATNNTGGVIVQLDAKSTICTIMMATVSASFVTTVSRDHWQ